MLESVRVCCIHLLEETRQTGMEHSEASEG